ncbi:hypothetical protein BIV23_32890 [Streptomyces monashensis]|uniref:Ig-like domain repeat protein n=1 Tax=Streptomyces monashensis TaxID=1678012 RepID=A0A1S2PSH7_9ACTN|nr:hypothetical protein BIV23_32890 [Streptomyces monashensis]
MPAGSACGSDGSPTWQTVTTPPPAGMTVSIGVPRPTVGGVSYQGVVHAGDVDGSQEADGSVSGVPVPYQSVYVPLALTDGHTYGWHASTYDGTAYSNPTASCYFRVDGSAPLAPVVTNPDFPPAGSPGTPKKGAGQPTTFSFTSRDPLPRGCAEAEAPDCWASGLDHFEYAFDQQPGIGAAQAPADAQGKGTLTASLTWGSHTLHVVGVDVAGNQTTQPTAYTFYVPWQLPAPTTINLAAPAQSGRASQLTVSGRLSADTYPSGEAVKVVKSDLAHPAGVALPDAPLSADGTFHITDVPQVGGANTYSVTYPGDSTHQATSASATVQVSRSTTAMSISSNASSYAYSATAKITAHLGTTYNGHTLSIYAEPYHGKKALVRTGTVDSHGNLTASYKVSGSTVFTASFAGDYRYAAATAIRTVFAYAKVSESLSGHDGSTHYGSILYRVYHHTAHAKLNVTVTPNKAGQCVQFQTQRYHGGAWHTQSTSSCHTLSMTSTTSATLGLTKAVNSRFRLRAEYVHSNKDTGSLNTWGAWQYFTVRQ